MPHDIEQKKEAGRKGGLSGKTHGLHAVQERGPAALTIEVEQMRYRELREALRQPAAREEIKLELMARLTTMMRVGFSEMESMAQQGRDPFGAPVVGRLGTYLNLLARLLNSFPQAKPDSLAEEIEKIQRLVAEADRQAETVVEPKSEVE